MRGCCGTGEPVSLAGGTTFAKVSGFGLMPGNRNFGLVGSAGGRAVNLMDGRGTISVMSGLSR